jgi:FHA domain
MPRVKISALLLAMSLSGIWCFTSMAEASAIATPNADAWLQGLSGLAQDALAVVSAGYRKAPVVVIVLSALVILPAVALFSFLVRGAARWFRRRGSSPSASAEWTRAAGSALDGPGWPTQAWLAIDGEAAGTHPIAGEMIRIGRHPDNEIWLTDTSVHRYHAVIHRTEDADFFITDLSGTEGNGVRINGARRSQSQLANGDIIELGKARMTFASVPI